MVLVVVPDAHQVVGAAAAGAVVEGQAAARRALALLLLVRVVVAAGAARRREVEAGEADGAERRASTWRRHRVRLGRRRRHVGGVQCGIIRREREVVHFAFYGHR